MFEAMCSTGIFRYTSQCVGYRMASEDPVAALVVSGFVLLLALVVRAWVEKR